MSRDQSKVSVSLPAMLGLRSLSLSVVLIDGLLVMEKVPIGGMPGLPIVAAVEGVAVDVDWSVEGNGMYAVGAVLQMERVTVNSYEHIPNGGDRCENRG